ncbi:hypothetical protein QJQ45_004460 [Haematococcus lacustris]|nr:hypothetical protein QJQ45_004460 [Haematococcus lacustris]
MMRLQGLFKFHQYQVTGRHLPTENEPTPTVYRMKVWASDAVRAKSKFWSVAVKWHVMCWSCWGWEQCEHGGPSAVSRYFLRKLRRVKKANGQVLAINEIFERKPTTVKNFGIWVRYQSRTGYHNMYKEYRDVTLNGAVGQLYQEMASRHRVRFPCIQIIKTATVPAAACKRANTQQFLNSKISFPLTRKVVRASRPELKTLYKASRPTVAMY